ncbi:hypothetical protein WS91_23375 [Burkholderia sp. MSMB1498]|nr:hypothetical protein WS91_23375 [Burkholderia sp. MSMB1498]
MVAMCRAMRGGASRGFSERFQRVRPGRAAMRRVRRNAVRIASRWAPHGIDAPIRVRDPCGSARARRDGSARSVRAGGAAALGQPLRERADICGEPERIAAICFVHEFAQRAAARERRVDVADGGEPRAIVDRLPREVSGDARDEAKEVDVRLLAKTRKAKGTQGCVGSCSPAHAANRRTITRPDVRDGLRDAA